MTLFDGGGLELGAGTTTPGKSRLKISGGTAIVTGDWAISAGWGPGATVTAVSGTDSRGTVTITTSAADTPTANPTATLTFKDGTWTVAPFVAAGMNAAGTGVATDIPWTSTATTMILTYDGTPAAVLSRTYILSYVVVG